MVSPTTKLNSGHEMPLVGFGLWKVDNATAADTVYNAIKVGYRLFDGACGKRFPSLRTSSKKRTGLDTWWLACIGQKCLYEDRPRPSASSKAGVQRKRDKPLPHHCAAASTRPLTSSASEVCTRIQPGKLVSLRPGRPNYERIPLTVMLALQITETRRSAERVSHAP